MDKWFIDYETFYSREYSLRRMTVPEYILDPRFECMGAALKREDESAFWLDAADLPRFFESLDPQRTVLISHNALFDACITAWIYGFVPRMTGDTLGIARATLGHELKSLSLASVAMHLKVGVKGDTIHKVEGMSAAAIKAAGLWESYTAYAVNDAEQCANIWQELVINRKFPLRELVLMDRIIRCATQPKFQLDPHVLAEHLAEVRAKKDALMARIGFTREELMSNDKFAAALQSLGVTPPRKTSLTTGKETWAFSKTDPQFIELEEHDDPSVQALVAARLGVKTTLEEKRTERFISLSNLQWAEGERWMPIPLRYGGAHTHRLSGEWKLNLQNLPRGGNLRRALIAPPGYKVIAPDSSQIEARINAWLGGEEQLLEDFRNDVDIYSKFAGEEVFNKPVNKKMKKERFVGKTSILGLGYGMGWSKFQATIKVQSRAQIGEEILLEDAEAQRIVQAYRTKYSGIASCWAQLNSSGINALAGGGYFKFKIGPCEFQKNKITLPSGLALHYHGLTQENGEWAYTYGGMKKRTYGGKLMENIVQALARIVVMDAALAIEKRFANAFEYPPRLALQVHDELVFIVRDEDVDKAVEICAEEMRRPPSWALDLPLASECDIGQNYGEAK